MPESKAVSPVVGMVLILAIIAGLMSIIQTKYVPQWDYQKEAQNFKTLISEVSSISSILTKQSSNSLQLDVGVRYPQYPFLINPPASYGVLRIIPEKVKVNYTIYGKTVSEEYNSSAIVITPIYLYMPQVNFSYEHGAVIEYGKNYRKPIMINQISFSKNEIDFPVILSKDESIAAESFILHFYPLSSGSGERVYNLSISFETLYPKLWKSTLESIYGSDAVVKVSGNTVSLTIKKAVYLRIPAWSLSTQPISVKNVSSNAVSAILVTPKHVYLNVNGTDYVSIQVLDRYGNPMKNVTLGVYVENSTVCNLMSKNVTTSFNGIARIYLRGLNPGTTKVVVKTDLKPTSSGSNKTVFNVTVVKSEQKIEIIRAIGEEDGYYTISISSGKCGCKRCGCCEIYYQVYDYNIIAKINGNSVNNIPVEFYFLDSENTTLYIGVTFTNESGYAHLTLIAGVRDDSASGTYTTPQVLLDSKPVKVIVVAGTSQKTKEISYR